MPVGHTSDLPQLVTKKKKKMPGHTINTCPSTYLQTGSVWVAAEKSGFKWMESQIHPWEILLNVSAPTEKKLGKCVPNFGNNSKNSQNYE